MNINEFKHKLKIQIRYKDIDKQGHLNNANHLTYFETARVDYFHEVFPQKVEWDKTSMILANAEINYKIPIFLEDIIHCYTRIESFGTKSFVIKNLLTKTENDHELICAEGKSIIVCFNYQINQTSPIPQEWKDAVNKFEGH